MAGAGGYDIGLSFATSSGSGITGPVSVNTGEAKQTPIVWLIIGAIVLVGLVVFLKARK
jgi:LPXTG-motif cell wall-anchored protein